MSTVFNFEKRRQILKRQSHKIIWGFSFINVTYTLAHYDFSSKFLGRSFWGVQYRYSSNATQQDSALTNTARRQTLSSLHCTVIAICQHLTLPAGLASLHWCTGSMTIVYSIWTYLVQFSILNSWFNSYLVLLFIYG